MKQPSDRLLDDTLNGDADYRAFRAELRERVVLEMRRQSWRAKVATRLAWAACLAVGVGTLWWWPPAPTRERSAGGSMRRAAGGVIVRTVPSPMEIIRSKPLAVASVVISDSSNVERVASSDQGLERIGDDELLRLPLGGRGILITLSSGEKRLMIVSASGEPQIFGP